MPAAVEDITGIFSLICEEEEIILSYCDMTPESRKCAVREAQQSSPLLDIGCGNIFPAATNEYTATYIEITTDKLL
jgi:hypothetical protein